jgi:type VI secretion system protein VasG
MKDSMQLLRKLNENCARALNEAANFCLSRGHQEILPEHFLVKLLETDNNDLNLLLRQNEININRLWDDLLNGLDKLPWQRIPQKPELSRALLKWIEQAWMLASIEHGQEEVRSLHLLEAIQKIPSIFTLTDLWQLLIFRAGQLAEAGRWLDKYSVEANTQNDSTFASATDVASKTAESVESDITQTSLNSSKLQDKQSPAEQEALSRFTIDLTQRAREGHIDAIFGRDEEISQIEDILSRRRKNNPILVGEPGVGKTALVEGLALKIAHDEVGSHLKNTHIVALDMGLLQAGSGLKGEFEQRLKTVIEAIQHAPEPTILFIDEAHTIIGAGNQAGGSDAANLLKPALARGQLRTIAATTWSEYKQYFETDAALERRFQPVKVDEPDDEKACQMLRGIAKLYAEHHQVHIKDDAIKAAVTLSRRYLPDRQLPDKAIDLLDTAAAKVRLGLQTLPLNLIKQISLHSALKEEIERLQQDSQLGHSIDSERMQQCQQQLQQLDLQIEEEKQKFAQEQKAAQAVLDARTQSADNNSLHAHNQSFQQVQQNISLDVDQQVIASVISEWTGIPAGRMLDDEIARLMTLAEQLNNEIIGQEDSVNSMVNHIRTQKAGLGEAHKPLGVFLLTGTSGVGKTRTAKALAKSLFGSENTMITINMSEYQEAHTVAQLKGAPPGYVGYGKGGVLTEAVRKRPYSVVLLDEIEKAHPDVLNIFYQVFDQGIMRDGEGRIINFKNTILLMTSNLGSEALQNAPDADLPARLELVDQPIREVLAPALLGRMNVLAFRPLSAADMQIIIRQQLDHIAAKIAVQFAVTFHYSHALVAALAQTTAGHDLGVRYFEQMLQQQIVPELAKQLLMEKQQGQHSAYIHLDLSEQGIAITLSDEPMAAVTEAIPEEGSENQPQ